MVLQKLREETSDLHNQMENTPLLNHFREKTISDESYSLILKKFFSFFSNLETELNSFSEIENFLPDYHERRKSNLILTDLKALNQAPLNITEKIIPDISSAGEAFGCLYVMEGSTLGGKIISSVIMEKLKIGAETGGSFFYGYGPETGIKWKNFCSALNTFSEEKKQEDAVVKGASETFLKLKNWLEA